MALDGFPNIVRCLFDGLPLRITTGERGNLRPISAFFGLVNYYFDLHLSYPVSQYNISIIRFQQLAKKDLAQKIESMYAEWDKVQEEIENAQSQAGFKLIKKPQP